MKMNRNKLGKMMSEFSQELGMPAQRKAGGLGRKMLWAAGSAAGFLLWFSMPVCWGLSPVSFPFPVSLQSEHSCC
jgi:hypothetical protein